MHYEVAIIGAGLSGLVAAKTLLDSNHSNFIIIEAQSQAGGRINSQNICGNIVELGAQWIHGKKNPLFELAKKHKLISEKTKTEGLGIYIRENGEIIESEIVKNVDLEIYKILSECETFVWKTEAPKSVGEFMKMKFTEYLEKSPDSNNIKEIKWELFDWHVRFQMIENSCLNLNRLSAKKFGQFLQDESNQLHIHLNCSVNKIIQILFESLPKNSVIFNAPVTVIRRAKKFLDHHKITLKDGSTITCDYLILTPSLGVLKKLKVYPKLPKDVYGSIQNLGYHSIGKIFLFFEYKWWTEDGFQFLWNKNTLLGDEDNWVKFITGFDSILFGSNVLLGWVGSYGVEVMESLNEEEVGRHCMVLLRRFIRHTIIPDPIKVVKSKWLTNPYILGSYSHITSKCDSSNLGIQNLSKPIYIDGKPSILIAGEGTSVSHYSTMHGAYETGQKQAELLAKYIKESQI